jgi:hypothetical protein
MPPFFMATTIKVDGTIAPFTWQDDQLLDEDSLVDFYVQATNLVDTFVPGSTVGTGGDVKVSAPATKAAK